MYALPFGPSFLNESHFQHFHAHEEDLPSFISVGWQMPRGEYSWDGMMRWDQRVGLCQLTLEGEGRLERQGVTYRLTPGTAMYLEVPDAHRYYLPEPRTQWNFVYLDFQGCDGALDQIRWLTAAYGPTCTLTPDSPVYALFAELATVVHARAIPSAEMGALWLSRFFLTLRATLPSRCAMADTRLTAVQHYLHTHFATPIDMLDMARNAGLTPSYFCHLFHQQFGISPHAYLNTLRLAHGEQLLRYTERSVGEISLGCGFGNGNYFAKVFKKAYGITPLQYRAGVAPLRSPRRPLSLLSGVSPMSGTG